MKFQFLSKMADNISTMAGVTGLKLKEKSPEIFFAVGVGLFIGAMIDASRAGLEIPEILEEHRDDMERVKNYEYDEEYTEEAAQRDTVRVYGRTTVAICKVYARPVSLGVLSIGCFFTAKKIMEKRYLATLIALNSVTEAFNAYRERTIEEYGEDVDRHLRYGTSLTKEEQTVTDEKGKKHKEEVVVKEDIDASKIKGIKVIFDEANPNWSPDPSLRKYFLTCQETMATNVLQARGYIFLNDILKSIGQEPIPEGQDLGWALACGDDYVDFGAYIHDDINHLYVDGRDDVILLDFSSVKPIKSTLIYGEAIKIIRE